MARLIRKNASAADIVRCVRLTRANACAKGESYQEDADHFLAVSAQVAVDLATRIAQNLTEVDRLRATQAVVSERSNDQVRAVKDRLYNQSGRTARDPIMAQIYSGGADRYCRVSLSDKPAALRLNAELIEVARHPKLPPELVEEVVGLLRAEAAALEQINQSLNPKRTERRLLLAQYTANARLAQTELSRLKHYWKSQGESEHDIHLLVPAVERSGGGKAAELTPEAAVEAALSDLTLLGDPLAPTLPPAPLADVDIEVAEPVPEAVTS